LASYLTRVQGVHYESLAYHQTIALIPKLI